MSDQCKRTFYKITISTHSKCQSHKRQRRTEKFPDWQRLGDAVTAWGMGS